MTTILSIEETLCPNLNFSKFYCCTLLSAYHSSTVHGTQIVDKYLNEAR